MPSTGTLRGLPHEGLFLEIRQWLLYPAQGILTDQMNAYYTANHWLMTHLESLVARVVATVRLFLQDKLSSETLLALGAVARGVLCASVCPLELFDASAPLVDKPLRPWEKADAVTGIPLTRLR